MIILLISCMSSVCTEVGVENGYSVHGETNMTNMSPYI